MTVYSRLLAAGDYGEGDAVLFTPAAGTTTVVRDIVLTVPVAETAAVGVYFKTPGGDVMYVMVQNVTAQYVSYHWSGRQVLPDDYVLWLTNLCSLVQVLVSGYVLGG